ncbi:diaminopimelate decarboxylase [Crossiella equi]|uniref:Diaminopimelate decarboxylase n=1 Tax=Crossiella equi TaxID=130796 RepID=A0ABS5A591_9PSEU|nr:hypothetical protein [Crossiella equi]MBP2471447.1 diaminopimelate decarboxylase [Crossiella equi]
MTAIAPVGHLRPAPEARLRALAEQWRGRTPVIAYDTDGVDAEVEAARADLERVPARTHTLLFSVKANRFPGLLAHLAGHGIGAAVAGPTEYRAATGAGMAAVCATTPGLTREDLHALHAAGVGIDADSERQLADLPRGAHVGLRLAIPIEAGSTPRGLPWSRFGMRWPSASACAAVAARDLRVVRLHAHVRDIGGPEDTDLLGRVLARAAQDLPTVTELNLGGGTTRLRHHNAEAAAQAYDVLADRLGGAEYDLYAEPGAHLVTAHGYLVSEVLDVEVAGGRQLAVLDASAWNLAGWSRFSPVWLTDSDGAVLPTDFAGPTCYEKDLWLTGVPSGPLHRGDLVVLRGAGAYVTSMARRLHDLPLPAEVLLPAEGGPR